VKKYLVSASLALFLVLPAWSQEEEDLGAEIDAAESLESESPSTEGESGEITLEPLEEPLTPESEPVEEPEIKPEPVVSPDAKPESEPVAEPEPEPEDQLEPLEETVAEPEPEPEPVTPTPEPVTPDAPNLEYEARLYDIFIHYNSKRLGDDEWAALIGDRESEVYRIQSGDTLWGISKLFFNDGNYWPKIWSLNSRITNPHLIQPGNEIRFLLGTESDAPSFTVTEAGSSPEPEIPPPPSVDGAAVTGVDDSDSLPTDEVEIPPPSEVFQPVLKKLPPSLPEWTMQLKTEQYDETGIAFGRRPIADLKDTKFLSAFVDDDGLQFDGEISEIEGGAQTAANFQYVFVSLPQGSAKTGDVYTAVIPRGRLLRSTKEVSRGDLGYYYQILGEVKIDSLLTSSDGKDVFRALVQNSLSQVEQGAKVRLGSMPVVQLTGENDQKLDLVLQIIGGELMERQVTLGLHSLAFLNGGQDRNLKVGEILTVRANTRIRNPKSKVKESYIPVGQLRIVHVGRRYSTAIVTRVWDAIFVGDVTGEGKVIPPEPRPKEELGPSRASRSEPDGTSEDDVEQELEEEFEEDFE